MRFIFTAARNDGCRLHLLIRNVKSKPFVVCWNYDTVSDSWDWGTYCTDLKRALSAFNQKIIEHDFTDVFEGYLEKNYAK
jgi:hypothetical protein